MAERLVVDVGTGSEGETAFFEPQPLAATLSWTARRSSDASDILSDAGFASFKIPNQTVAQRAELNKLEYRRLAKQFVWHLLGLFAPDLLVVDTFPAGSFDELFQVLDGPFKKGFLFHGVKPGYAARPTFKSALGLYDTVVVPHR